MLVVFIFIYLICFVTGPWRGSLGALFVSENWRVRVLWSYGLVDRPSDHLCVRTITLYRCMDRCFRYRQHNALDKNMIHTCLQHHLQCCFQDRQEIPWRGENKYTPGRTTQSPCECSIKCDSNVKKLHHCRPYRVGRKFSFFPVVQTDKTDTIQV